MKKTVNGHFLFRLQYNCPVFPSKIQDRRRSGQRFFDILILFCGDDLFSPSKLSHGRLPKYLIDKRTFRTNFQVAPAPAPISSRFLCPRPPLLLSSSNQNRHATQATPAKKCTKKRDARTKLLFSAPSPMYGNPRQSSILDSTQWTRDSNYWIPDLFQ